MNKTKELRRFLLQKSGVFNSILAGAFLLLVGLIWLIELILNGGTPWFVWILSVVSIGLGVLLFWIVLGDIKKLNLWLTEHNQVIDTVWEEFQSGKQFFMGRLRMGNTYIFGQGNRRIYTYSDIVQIYMRTHYTNLRTSITPGVEDYTALVIVHSSGAPLTICKGKSKGEHLAAIAFIKEKNPLVIISTPFSRR